MASECVHGRVRVTILGSIACLKCMPAISICWRWVWISIFLLLLLARNAAWVVVVGILSSNMMPLDVCFWLYVSAQLPLLNLCYHIHQTPLLIQHHNASICMKYMTGIHHHMWMVVAKQLFEAGDHYLQQKCYFLACCIAGWWMISTWLPEHSLLVSTSHHLWKENVVEEQVHKPRMLSSQNCYSEHLWFCWITHLDWLLHFVPWLWWSYTFHQLSALCHFCVAWCLWTFDHPFVMLLHDHFLLQCHSLQMPLQQFQLKGTPDDLVHIQQMVGVPSATV